MNKDDFFKFEGSYGQTNGSNPMAIIKLGIFALSLAILIPVQTVIIKFFPEKLYGFPRKFHGFLLWLIGIHVVVKGTPSTQSPTLFVANHTSYLDIPVIGSIIKGSFVAKSEVNSWPLFGLLSRLQNTVFIERRRSQAQEHKNELLEMIEQGNNLIVFPEGTSSDGQTVLKFKSSLFSIADAVKGKIPLYIQPISATFTGLGGLPVTSDLRHYYSWYGDMTLPPHLWNVFRMGGFTVTVIFHDVIGPNQMTNRKMLAATCQEQVARGIEQSVTGRLPPITVDALQILPPATEEQKKI